MATLPDVLTVSLTLPVGLVTWAESEYEGLQVMTIRLLTEQRQRWDDARTVAPWPREAKHPRYTPIVVAD